MVDLCQTYEAAGLFLAPGELPDHLTVVLEYASTQPPRAGPGLPGEIAHILQVIFSALLRRESPRQRAGRVARPGGREGAGRHRAARARARRDLGRAHGLRRLFHPGPGRPGQPQPIQIVRAPVHTRRATPHAGSVRMNTLHNFAFNVYPYICLAVFFMGSLARFDRDQYTWKSDSSQLLRKAQLRWGSNLFHGGILFLFFGHLFGQLTPHWLYEIFVTAPQKQLIAVVAGGVAGGCASSG
jgi:hypothetical protein